MSRAVRALVVAVAIVGAAALAAGAVYLIGHRVINATTTTTTSNVSTTTTIRVSTPTTQPLNCGALPAGPGAGPKPAACGLP